MVREIRIYIEGGGDGQYTKRQLRTGFGKFLRELREKARTRQIGWKIIICGSRGSTHDGFITACQKTYAEAFNVLLVDSEGSVSSSPKQHLRDRDRWQVNESEEQYHLMVQTMEAWLIADREAVMKYYGQGFHESALPVTQDVEQIDKDSLKPCLDRAAKQTTKQEYREIRDGAKLLERIDANTVRLRAPHCERLFVTLSNKLEEN